MSPSLKPFIVVFTLGQVALLWWFSGQYRPSTSPAAETTTSDPPPAPIKVSYIWSADEPVGKFWGNDKGKVIDREGSGVNGSGKAITLRFDGEGWRGAGLNWKSWNRSNAGTDASGFKSLVFHVRQLTSLADADLLVQLGDNLKREEKGASTSNDLSILKDGRLARIDSEWQRVVLPLAAFARDRDLDLTRLWEINFGDGSGRSLAFQIDQIGFSDDTLPEPKFHFPTSAAYNAVATIRTDKASYPIRDEIYGASDMAPDQIAGYGLAMMRWGGNHTSRFNPMINAENAGKDWFFKNRGEKTKDPTQGGWSKFERDNRAAGAASYVTIPTLGFVAKDGKSSSYSVNKYGVQQSVESGHPDVGNGRLANGEMITVNEWQDTSVQSTPEFIAQGVRLVVRQAGDSRKPRYWALDNEPMLWHDTHRDVRKEPLGAKELWDKTVRYAETVKAADPTAKIAGFVSWGWADLYYSALDKGYDDYSSRQDYAAHDGLPLAEWFIKKCGEYKRQTGKSLVDVFDFHWYPQKDAEQHDAFEGLGNDLKLAQYRLRSTRDLWDPTYQQESWIREFFPGQPTMVLRRIREWIDKHNPGMEISIGEYNFGGRDNISGPLAQADVFGILAREKVDLAFVWSHSSSPLGLQEAAWKLFRNHDGIGGRFGDNYVPSESDNTDLAVYAAKRSKDGATTIAVINKNLGGPCTLTLNMTGLKGKMRVYRFDQDTGTKVVEVTRESRDVDGKVTLTMPAASGTMLVIQ